MTKHLGILGILLLIIGGLCWLFAPALDLPALKDFSLLIAAGGLVALLVWLARPQTSASGFIIRVDDNDITFAGQFPSAMQTTVTDFLRHDCQIPGPYEIRGHWDDSRLVVIVKGENARPLEQRIRNFLKMSLRQPK